MMNWKNGIALRFAVQCLASALLTLAIALVGYHSLSSMSDSDNTLHEVGVVNLNDAATLAEQFATTRATVRDLCLSTDWYDRQKHKDDYDRQKLYASKTMDKLHASAKGIPEKVVQRNAVAAAMAEYFKVSDGIADFVMAGRNGDAVQFMRTQAVPANAKFREEMDGMQNYMSGVADEQLRSNLATAGSSKVSMMLGALLVIALSVVLGVFLANRTVERLKMLLPQAVIANWRNEITQKFTVQSLVTVLLTIVIALIGYFSISSMGESDVTLHEVGVVNLNDANTLAEQFATARAAIRDLCLSTDAADRQKYKADFDKIKLEANKTMDKLYASAKGIPEKVVMRNAMAVAINNYFDVSDGIVDLVMAGRNADATRYMRTQAVPANAIFRDEMGKMQDYMSAIAEEQLISNHKTARSAKATMLTVMLIAVVLSVVLGVFLANQTVERLKMLLPAAGGQGTIDRAAFCAQCGTRLQAGSRFCHKCGHGVGQALVNT